MKKVLMISYNYPPISDVGTIRNLKFSKYLLEYGWNPHVLTIKNPDRFYTSTGEEQIPAHVCVYRAWNIINNLSVIEGGLRKLKICSRFIIPDAYVGWIPDAIRLGRKIIKNEGIDIIYVSSPPHSSSLIAMKLSELTGIPFILDLRDAWTENPYSGEYLTKILKNIDQALEKKVFISADYIITATDGIQTDYQNKYLLNNICTIFNGFDLADIPETYATHDCFTITYTGFFYGVRTPEMLFAALRKIIKNNIIPKSELQFLWAGRKAPHIFKLADMYEIRDIINYVGLISKNEADNLLYMSDLLFFVIGSTEQISQNNTLTGKLFPYLASGTPILAVIPDGDAKKLIEQYSDNSYIITSGNIDDIVEAIVDGYIKWKSGFHIQRSDNKVKEFRKEYNYRALTEKLARIFDLVSAGNK